VVAAPELVIGVLQALDSLEIPYAVGGSFASSAWGQPRQTRDLDVGVLVTLDQVRKLANILRDEFLLSDQTMEEAALGTDQFRSFQLIHMEEVFKIDIFALDVTPYTQAMLARRRPFNLSSTYSASFLSPEDIVITKLRWFVLSNRVSDRQWNDIVQVLETQGKDFDYSYASTWAESFGVIQDLQNAKAQVTPL
jgi:hypothetical protein